MDIKPLEWEGICGGYAYRAPALFFGSFRVEKYGGFPWQASWSAPGFSGEFVEGEWTTADEAKAAVQAEYEARIRAVLLPPAPTTGDTHE